MEMCAMNGGQDDVGGLHTVVGAPGQIPKALL